MNRIKFTVPLSKLFYNSSPIGSATLLQVLEADYSDLTQEFKDYDTDFGKYQLPTKGPCLVLLFTGLSGLFTTVRTSDKAEHYRDRVGQAFSIELEHSTNN